MPYVIKFLILLLMFFYLAIFKIKLSPPDCLATEKEECMGIKVYVCETKKPYYNAWFEPESGKIYISKNLYKILNKRELEMVLRHELAHKSQLKPSIWFIIKILSSLSTILFLSNLLMAYIILLIFNKLSYSLYLSFLLIYSPISSLSSLVSWIYEHEADRASINKKEDAKDFIRMLFKLDVARIISKYRPTVKMNFKDINKLININLDNNSNRKYDFLNFLKEFYLYIFHNVAFSPLEPITKEFYTTHPLIKWRIRFLTGISKEYIQQDRLK